MSDSNGDLVRDLKRLLGDQSPADSFTPHTPRSSITGQRTAAPTKTGTTAGIASPLTEPDYDQREYYDTELKTSSDGLFTLPIKPIKKLVLQDANKAAVVIELADPEGSS